MRSWYDGSTVFTTIRDGVHDSKLVVIPPFTHMLTIGGYDIVPFFMWRGMARPFVCPRVSTLKTVSKVEGVYKYSKQRYYTGRDFIYKVSYTAMDTDSEVRVGIDSTIIPQTGFDKDEFGRILVRLTSTCTVSSTTSSFEFHEPGLVFNYRGEPHQHIDGAGYTYDLYHNMIAEPFAVALRFGFDRAGALSAYREDDSDQQYTVVDFGVKDLKKED